jgi:hypothetical protein
MSINTEEYLSTYRNDGFVCPVPAIGEEKAAEALKKIEEIELEHGGKWPSEYALKPHLIYPFLNEIL